MRELVTLKGAAISGPSASGNSLDLSKGDDKAQLKFEAGYAVPIDERKSASVSPDSVPEVCRGVPFMSSLQIAEVLGMRHDNVLRDIERRLANIGEDALRFEGIYWDSMNRSRRCYCLPGKYLLFITTAYDDVGRMGLIEHWEAVNEGWIKPQQGAVNHVVQRLVNGGRKARMLELQEAEQRARLDGRLLTARERNLILLP